MTDTYDPKQFDPFFKSIEDVLTRQDEQKKRGLNDFNLLTTVLKASDEVNLHSRFLYSMLNPSGVHYQGHLFLKLFFELVLGENPTDYSNFEVKREKDNIDLLITDGEKYYIIENKIYALDQPRQIAKYIQLVKDKYGADIKNINVYYLSPKANHPTPLSLGKFKRVADKLTWKTDRTFKKGRSVELIALDLTLDKSFKNKDEVQYKKIGYKAEIIIWLDQCLKETENLTNLNFAFSTYRDVVERVIKTRSPKVTTISDSLIKTENKKNLLLALKVEKALPKVKGKMLYNFFKSLTQIDVLKDKEANMSKYSKIPLKSYNEDNNCTDWFDSSKKNRKNIGIVFKLNHDDFNLCIMVASKKLHIGLISKDGEATTPEPNIDLGNPSIELKKREWKNSLPIWYSYIPTNDSIFNFNSSVIDFLSNKGNERKMVGNVITTIITQYDKK